VRRVDRGPWPVDSDGHERHFNDHPRAYRKAKPDLLARLGGYCSYCERVGDLHVEHIVPKEKSPDLIGEWSNFLLGCSNCNSIKRDRNDSRHGYIWPDTDDTEVAFEYLVDGIVRVRPGLSEELNSRADRLYDLVGLGRTPSSHPEASDLRWLKRREAWRVATRAKRSVSDGANGDIVIELAKATGFCSVWITVFADDAQFCDRLRQCFPGTR